MIFSIPTGVLQEAVLPPASSEGLPFWLLYVLVCVVILVTAFLFLRNKEFREKLNFFFSGAGRRMKALRLKAQIRRERNKRDLLFQEVGKKAWVENIEVRGTEREIKALTALQAKLDRLHAEWHKAYTRAEEINGGRGEKDRTFALKLDGLYKEQAPLKVRQKAAREERKALLQSVRGAEHEIRGSGGPSDRLRNGRPAPEDEGPGLFASPQAGPGPDADAVDGRPPIEGHIAELESRVSVLRARKDVLDIELSGLRDSLHTIGETIRRTEEARRLAMNRIDEEVREADRARETVQRTILQTRRRMEPFFQAVGKAIARERLRRDDLEIFYIQFEEMDRRLRELGRQLDDLY